MDWKETADSARRPARQWTTWFMALLLLLSPSCRQEGGPRHFLGEPRQAEYIDRAMKISYADVNQPVSKDVNFANEPKTIRDLDRDEMWDLTLAETIQISLSNSQVIRNSGQFLNPGNPLLANPDFAATVFDPAIQSTGVLFGQRGVEGALSDFDTQFTTQMLFGRNETIQNNTISVGLPAGEVLVDETGTFNSTFQKRLASGGQVSLGHVWNYTARNIESPPQLFPSVYEGSLQLQFRQPLLAGAGVEFTRIAGPITANIEGISGVQQGVIIARINEDISLADFERAVHQLLHDLESLYWQLHFAYQSFAVQVEARNAAMDAWRLVEAQRIAETGPGGAQETELRDIYLDLKGRVDAARDNIYATEARLRLLMGLSVSDGRIIRPIDTPMTAELIPDWSSSLADALVRRPEIRRQKWNIRSLELQVRAAENMTMPRLDFISAYQLNAFGDRLISHGTTMVEGRNLASAYSRLARAGETGWNLGLEFSVPLGRRFALAQVQTTEFRLAKAQALLGEQEVEISHEVAAAFRDIDRTYMAMENSYNRLQVSRDRLNLVEAQYRSDPQRYTIDSVVRARQSAAQAELTFLSNTVQYNVAVAELHYRTGRTLTVNNIHLMEGPWHADAAIDAMERYEERRHAEPTVDLHQSIQFP